MYSIYMVGRGGACISLKGEWDVKVEEKWKEQTIIKKKNENLSKSLRCRAPLTRSATIFT